MNNNISLESQTCKTVLQRVGGDRERDVLFNYELCYLPKYRTKLPLPEADQKLQKASERLHEASWKRVQAS
jgi:hypothetical protein